MRSRSKLVSAVARRPAASRRRARLDLVGGQRLVVERGRRVDSIALVAASGAITLSLRVTPEGAVLCFENGLSIEASGALALAGKRVAIRGDEGVEIVSGADASIEVVGDLSSNARVQNVRARLGNVNLKANDDVKLVGERILLNC